MSKKKKDDFFLKDKVFWLVLAAVVILPLMGMLTGMFTLELATSGKAIQTISYKTAGSELHFEVKNIEGVKEMTVTFLEDAKDMAIEFEEIDTISWNFDGIVYSQFKVVSADASKFGEMKFVLKLKETELNKLGLSGYDVRLYAGGQELETTVTRIEMGYIYCEAVSDQAGEFVIGKAKVEEKEVVEEEEVEIVEEVEPEIVEPIVEQPAPVKVNFVSKTTNFLKNLNKWWFLVFAFFVILIVVFYLLEKDRLLKRKK